MGKNDFFQIPECRRDGGERRRNTEVTEERAQTSEHLPSLKTALHSVPSCMVARGILYSDSDNVVHRRWRVLTAQLSAEVYKKP